ncbi:MAG: FeoA family protein [Lautropia sp.]|nr:FeoA family protein [Lautropia sp.]
MAVIPLTELTQGAQAHIDSIVPNTDFGDLDSIVTRRLGDLGFSDGVPLLLVAKGVLGKGPFAVRLGNQSQFALREPEADKILCRIEI